MTTEENHLHNEPCFVISVAARIVGVHAQTLRQYERAGLIWPSRTTGRQRLYSMADIERIRRLRTLIDDMGVNLAGAEVALKLMDRINELEGDLAELTKTIESLRAQSNGHPGNRTLSPVSVREVEQ